MKTTFRLGIALVGLGLLCTGLIFILYIATPAVAATIDLAPADLSLADTALAPNFLPDSTLASLQNTPGPALIKPDFFGMITVHSSTSNTPIDYPPLTFGTMGHPQIGAWPWIEQTQGTYDFSYFDAFVAAAEQHQLYDQATNTVNIAITLGETPPWAAANPNTCNQDSVPFCTSGPSTAHLADWKKFIQQVTSHYDGHDSAHPFIRYYELWNEMDVSNFYTGKIHGLVELAAIAYPIIHKNPSSPSMLLTPSVAGSVAKGAATMEKYLQLGGAHYADGGAFHGYIASQTINPSNPYPMPDENSGPNCAPPSHIVCYGSIISKTLVMRQVFNKNGLKGKPMLDTEGSWGNCTVIDSATQTAWLAQWYLLQAGLSSTTNLRMAAWFTWGEYNDPSCTPGSDGTVRRWGTIENPDRTATEAGNAINQVQNWVVGSSMLPCTLAIGGVRVCRVYRPAGAFTDLVAWTNNGVGSFNAGPNYCAYQDIDGGGGVLPTGDHTFHVTAKPLLIEWCGKPGPIPIKP